MPVNVCQPRLGIDRWRARVRAGRKAGEGGLEEEGIRRRDVEKTEQ